MDKHPPTGSLLYTLERFEVGIVQLDRELRVVAMNDCARRLLPVDEMMPFDKVVTAFHPEHAHQKIRFLIDQAESPVSHPMPMTMIINIPERVLLIKVSKLSDARDQGTGYCFVMYDITEAVSSDITSPAQGTKRQLQKIPTMKQNRIVLVDTGSVAYIHSEGHYTWVQTTQGQHFCNLAIGDLEDRLDPEAFLRVHRSYIVNLARVAQILRDDGRVVLTLQGDEGTKIPVSRASVPKLMEHLGLAEVPPKL